MVQLALCGMLRLIENEKLTIPLYHGTSSLFSESIGKVGLGAIDPIEHYSVRAYLKSLFDFAKTALANDRSWQDVKFAVEWMVDQRVLDSGANFQHGQTYLTPSRESAVRYALGNRYGSELLSQTHRVLSWLLEKEVHLMDELGLHNHPVTKIFESNPKPMLITVHKVKLSQLAAENGGPVEPVLEKLAAFLEHFGVRSQEILKTATLPLNFRLIKPLDPGAVVVESLNPEVERNPHDQVV